MDFQIKVLNFIQELGLDERNYYQINTLKDSTLPRDIVDKLMRLNIDSVYFFGDTPTLLFKYNHNTNNEELYSTLLKSWNFDKAPILFYITNSNIIIYNTFIFPDKEKIDSNIIGTKEDIYKYHFNNLSSESFWENEKNNFTNKNRINKRLLQNIIDSKKVLKSKNLKVEYIHNLIGRSLFLRYISDRKLIANNPFEDIKDIFLNKDNLYSAFSLIKKYFNGDLFPVTQEEQDAVTEEHLQVLYTLFSGGEILTGQQSLFSYYDFSIIPIKLISNIYEKFLHDGENIQQAYYTPLATVDLVFEQLLNTQKMKDSSFKILDPSCGSGIFLVTFLKKYFEQNPEKITPENILNFIEQSIFGIDVDEDAIKISIFSLYITVLEFFEQPAIQAEDFKFPDLLHKNFFIMDFFDIERKIEKKIGKFDFIVGNPPWGTIKESLKLYDKYCQSKNYHLSDKQIAQAFMYRVKDFMTPDTITAMVIPSKILYNSSAKQFRKNFLSLFDIKAIIEMSLERHKTFNSAIHPSAIVFYTMSSKNKENIFSHLTLQPSIFYDIFQIFIFSEENIKYISQKEILENDWLWKPLLYGSQYDINFLKRLKKNCQTTLQFLKNYDSNYGAGLIYTKKYSSTKVINENIYCNYKLLLTEKKTNSFYHNHIDLKQSPKLCEVYAYNTFHDIGSIISYEAPHLLIKRGVSSDGITVGITNEACVFKNSVFGVHLKDITILNFLGALYVSDLYKYFLFMISSSWGVERPEVLMKEHRQLPIPKDLKETDIILLADLYTQLSNFSSKNRGVDGLFEENKQEIILCKREINNKVEKLFGLKKIEKKLINYAVNNYPQISENKTNKQKVSIKIIKEYTLNFLKDIKVSFPKKSNHFQIYISIRERFVFIYFKKNVQMLTNLQEFVILDKPLQINDYILESTFNLSSERITTEVTFQRKIIGIDGENFYIIKPNFENMFHPLNALLDAKLFIQTWMYNV